MAVDTFVLWVHKDTGIKTIDDFVKAAKAAGPKWTMAGSGKQSEDELLTEFLKASYGLNEMKYVPYPGGGDVAASLAGKISNSTVNNPGEQLGFFLAGKTVPIITFTKARQPLFPDAPTIGETGNEFEYKMQRSVIGAPGMPKEAAQYYQNLMAQVYTTPEWQAFMKKKGMTAGFLTGDLLMDFWLEERKTHKRMLKEMGMIK
jgi:tripartite-type tricarboxylate transporter receptor subunit TctC